MALLQVAQVDEVDYSAWPVKELARFLKERGHDPTGIVEKADLVAKVKEVRRLEAPELCTRLSHDIGSCPEVRTSHMKKSKNGTEKVTDHMADELWTINMEGFKTGTEVHIMGMQVAEQGPEGEQPSAPPGYAWDPASNLFYSSESGMYFSPESGYFYSSGDGKWYAYDEASKSFVEVPPAQQ